MATQLSWETKFPLDLRLCVSTLSDVVPFEVSLFYTMQNNFASYFVAFCPLHHDNYRITTAG